MGRDLCIYVPMCKCMSVPCRHTLFQVFHHFCYSNGGTAAKLLIDAGAKVNAKDASGTTPLSVAAAMGHCNVISALLDSPETDINCQVL